MRRTNGPWTVRRESDSESQSLLIRREKILQAEVDAMELDLELDTDRGVRDVIVSAARKSSAAAALAAAANTHSNTKMQIDRPPGAPAETRPSQ